MRSSTCLFICAALLYGQFDAVPVIQLEPIGSADTPAKSRQTVDELLSEVPLIDGHNDLAWQVFTNKQNQLERVDMNRSLIGVWENAHTDIPRLRQGRLGAQFWAAYVPCSTQHKDAVRACIEQVDVIRRFIDQYPETFKYVTTADGILESFAAGKIGSLIGVESGHCVDSSLAVLRRFFDMGVRYLTLTHNCDTPWADASTNPLTERDGLSQFGVKLIAEMNRLGMVVDLSHVSPATMRKSLQVTKAPVIFSHSSVYALCNHPRNVPDDILELTRINDGLVMVNFAAMFITCSTTANLRDVADHIEYIRNRIGINHVGIGADYDGVTDTPVGLEDVSKYPNLFRELQNRGWSDADLKQLAGNNLLRVLRAVEQVSRNLQLVKPVEDLIPVTDLANNTACRT